MMLKKFALITAIGAATMSFASAQQPPANPAAPANPAVATPGPSAIMPAPGANSFTEVQAKTRLETQGFSAVSPLTKDKDGIWRGTASKAGRSMSVAVDYQGNIVER
jgi:hypothetical protein